MIIGGSLSSRQRHRTPKKSRSCDAAMPTTTQEKAFCHGRLIVQCMTSLSVRLPAALLLYAVPPPSPLLPLRPPGWKARWGGLLLQAAPRRGTCLLRAGARCLFWRGQWPACALQRLGSATEARQALTGAACCLLGSPCCCRATRQIVDIAGAVIKRLLPCHHHLDSLHARRLGARNQFVAM